MATKKLIIVLLFLCHAPLGAKELMFNVFMNNKAVGTHLYQINDSKVVSKANYQIRFMFMNFKYKHESFETYEDGCLIGIDSRTDDDGELYNVSGSGSKKGLNVVANDKTLNLPGCVSTFTYWDSNIVNKTQLLNAQNAELLDIESTKVGNEELDLAGVNKKATHYQLRATISGKEKFIIHLWYDEDGNWLQLLTPTVAGDLIYKRL